jgi:hypothetical protein
MLKKLVLTCCVLVALMPLAAFAQEEEWTEFTSEDGTVTFSYPASWIVTQEAGDPSITIASSQETLDLMNAEGDTIFPVGELGMLMLFVTNEQIPMVSPELDVTSETFYFDLVNLIAEQSFQEDESVDATAEPAETPEPEATEPMVIDATEEFPYTVTVMGDNLILATEDEAFMLYGYQTEYKGSDALIFAFPAGEDATGIAVIGSSIEDADTDQANTLKVLQLLESVEYTPAE